VYAATPEASIPIPLAALPRWILWERVRTPSGRTTKKPRGSTRNGPWAPLDALLADLPPSAISDRGGIGFVTTGRIDIGDGRALVAIDVDGCRDPATGEVAQWAWAVVLAFNSYTEITPSGSGLRIFASVTGAVPKLRTIPVPAKVSGGDHTRCEIQVFGSGPAGYVTVTGWHLEGAETEIRDGATGFAWLTKTYPQPERLSDVEYEPSPVGRAPSVADLDAWVRSRATTSDIALIERGAWVEGGYPSASEGWYALERLVLLCCADHLDVATRWLLDATAYGSGDVEDSKDPVRYGTEAWVRADLYRVAAKVRAEVTDVFTPVPIAPGERPLSEGQRGPFDAPLPPPEALPFTAEAPGAAAAPAVSNAYFEDVSALVARDPRPKWLVRGVMERDGLVVISGAPASFKSFLIFDIALALATGADWHDHKIAAATPVLIVVGEGRGGLSRRFKAWAHEHDVDLASTPLAVTRYAAQILDADGFRFVVEEAKRKCQDWRRVPGLIVIDTLNRNFGPGDENAQSDMTLFWQRCDQLRRIFPGCTVVVVHHVGHGPQNRSRGSSVIGATVDAEIIIAREHDKKTEAPLPHARVFFRKMKDAEEPAPLWLTTKFVALGHDEDGAPFGSLVVDRVGTCAPQAGGEMSDPRVQEDIDALLHAYREAPQANQTEIRTAAELSTRRFSAARRIALDFGLLRRDGTTTDTQHVVTVAGIERLEASPASADVRVEGLGGGDADGDDLDAEIAALLG